MSDYIDYQSQLDNGFSPLTDTRPPMKAGVWLDGNVRALYGDRTANNDEEQKIRW